jgi:hypothetical protein
MLSVLSIALFFCLGNIPALLHQVLTILSCYGVRIFPHFVHYEKKNGSQNHCIGIFILLLSWELLVFSTRKLFCLLVKTREFWGTMLTWEDKISYIRLKQKEVHAFGWKQARRDMQSALVNQDWSSNGLYITSGSNDPLIHIFSYHFEFLLVYLHFT